MKKPLLLFFILACLSCQGCGSGPAGASSPPQADLSPIQFRISLTGLDNFQDYAYDNQGGVIAAGSIYPDKGAAPVASIVRFLPEGGRKWTCSLEGTGFSCFTDVCVEKDGVYACGWRGDIAAPVIAKFSHDGKLLWKREEDLGENLDAGVRFDRCCPASGGGVIAAACLPAAGPGENDLLALIKYDSGGTPLWSREYDLAGESDAVCVLQARGCIYVSCVTRLLKTDDTGKELWQTGFFAADAYYNVTSIAESGNGAALSCSALYTGNAAPDKNAAAGDARHPSALLCIEGNGRIGNVSLFYGAEGCAGGAVFQTKTGYIQSVFRIDAIVPSLPSMNVSTMPQGRTVLLRYDGKGNRAGALELDSAGWKLAGVEGDRPVVLLAERQEQ